MDESQIAHLNSQLADHLAVQSAAIGNALSQIYQEGAAHTAFQEHVLSTTQRQIVDSARGQLKNQRSAIGNALDQVNSRIAYETALQGAQLIPFAGRPPDQLPSMGGGSVPDLTIPPASIPIVPIPPPPFVGPPEPFRGFNQAPPGSGTEPGGFNPSMFGDTVRGRPHRGAVPPIPPPAGASPLPPVNPPPAGQPFVPPPTVQPIQSPPGQSPPGMAPLPSGTCAAVTGSPGDALIQDQFSGQCVPVQSTVTPPTPPQSQPQTPGGGPKQDVYTIFARCDGTPIPGWGIAAPGINLTPSGIASLVDSGFVILQTVTTDITTAYSLANAVTADQVAAACQAQGVESAPTAPSGCDPCQVALVDYLCKCLGPKLRAAQTPVDIDQPLAFLFGEGQAKWHTKAIAYVGQGLADFIAAPTVFAAIALRESKETPLAPADALAIVSIVDTTWGVP